MLIIFLLGNYVHASNKPSLYISTVLRFSLPERLVLFGQGSKTNFFQSSAFSALPARKSPHHGIQKAGKGAQLPLQIALEHA